MAKEKSGSKKRDRNKNPAWGIRIPLVYRNILHRLAKEGRRNLTEQAKIAFEEHFQKHKAWPPTDEDYKPRVD